MFNPQEIEALDRLRHEYFQLKRAILYVESLDPQTKVNIQLLKEQRDALDHLMGILRNKLAPSPDDKEDYFKINVDKALGHIYRAGFDTYDCEVMVAKADLEEFLTGYPPDVCHTVIPEYTQKKTAIRDLITEMAELRGQKDGGIDLSPIFDQYIKKLDELKSITKLIYKCREELDSYRKSAKRFWRKDYWKAFVLILIGVLLATLVDIAKDSIKSQKAAKTSTQQTSSATPK